MFKINGKIIKKIIRIYGKVSRVKDDEERRKGRKRESLKRKRKV